MFLRMKIISGVILFLFILSSKNSSAQTTSNHVKGDILVQLKPNTAFSSLENNLIISKKIISRYCNIWLLQFNADSLNENDVLNYFRQNKNIDNACDDNCNQPNKHKLAHAFKTSLGEVPIKTHCTK